MRTFLIVFWGIFATLTTVATIYVLINYEVQRWKDKQRQREGIYIRRVTRLEALIVIFTPVFPCAMFAGHIFFDPESARITIDITALLVSIPFAAYLRYVHVAYVKTSADGIEQRIWFSNPTRYPFNAINRVVYYEKPDIDEPDMVGFYAKSGIQIALFDPITHNNYRLLAIVRFRIENERWPDMDNPDDVAQVDAFDKRGMTISYFKGLKKVTGLADVDM
ncbi:hypothetical protein [uncultured Rothia sp.]|uniref:hypothetical protein n=1 Tax=uncultured Rothia sp. TaxID=316088 RepID=UPI002616C526|nr:hypothetical protein [uncultured Rothia sp.]